MKIQNSHGKTISKEEVASLPVEGDGDSADENLAKAEAELPEKPGQRPSLEVESEVHANLWKRILAHLGRMRAWDLRKAGDMYAGEFRDAIQSLEEEWKRVTNCLDALSLIGFVAKTTPVTRIASKLTFGALVDLREDQRAVPDLDEFIQHLGQTG